jgi:putative transposase
MPNHYHLLLETPRPTLVKGMQWLNATYTQRYNGRHKTRGHLFQGRYKALLVDGQSRGYFLTVSDYIHLNPVRARLVKTAAEFWAYRWSSAAWLAGKRPRRPDWLRFERVYGELGLRQWDGKTRRLFAQYLARRVAEPTEGEVAWKRIRRGWCLGGEEFVAQMKDRLAAMADAERRPECWSGEAVEELEEERAQRLLRQAVQVLGYCGPREVRGKDRYLVARLLRQKSKVSVGWLAEQFGLQTRGGMSAAMHDVGRQLGQDKALQTKWSTLASL